jgi:hypothetical protein
MGTRDSSRGLRTEVRIARVCQLLVTARIKRNDLASESSDAHGVLPDLVDDPRPAAFASRSSVLSSLRIYTMNS